MQDGELEDNKAGRAAHIPEYLRECGQDGPRVQIIRQVTDDEACLKSHPRASLQLGSLSEVGGTSTSPAVLETSPIPGELQLGLHITKITWSQVQNPALALIKFHTVLWSIQISLYGFSNIKGVQSFSWFNIAIKCTQCTFNSCMQIICKSTSPPEEPHWCLAASHLPNLSLTSQPIVLYHWSCLWLSPCIQTHKACSWILALFSDLKNTPGFFTDLLFCCILPWVKRMALDHTTRDLCYTPVSTTGPWMSATLASAWGS